MKHTVTAAFASCALFALSLLRARLATVVRGRALLAGAALLLALTVTACGSSSHGGSGPDVVATTTQIADWTRAQR